MSVGVVVAHHHPGRLRLRSPAFERGGEAARRALRGRDGVVSATVTPATGSLLVLYDPARVGVDALVDAVARACGLVLVERAAKPGDEDRLSYVAIDLLHEVNAVAQELTRHRADLRVLVPAALGGLSAYALLRDGPRLPPWENLLYWSYTVFLSVNQREIEQRTHERAVAR